MSHYSLRHPDEFERDKRSLPDSRVEAIYHSASIQVQFDQLERDTKKCCEILNDCAKAVQS